MRALVFTAPGVVELQDVPEPSAAPGETLVHVRSAGICGSELHGVLHPGFRMPPLIMGHEFAGVTSDGAEVIVNPVLSCGHCDLCTGGDRQLCRERVLVGIGRPGAFAERVAVPDSALRPKPAGLSWTSAALAEPAATAVHAIRLAGGVAGMRVAVLGCGAIGLFTVLAAESDGAASVDAVDVSPGRLAVAARLGARARLPATLEDEYDLIVDAVGTAQTRAQSVAHLRPGGATIWLGLATTDPGFDAQALVRTQKRVIGSFAYTDDAFDAAAGLLGSWDLSWAVPVPLSDGARVFTSLMNGAPEPGKAVLHPGDLASPAPAAGRPDSATAQ